MSKEIPILMNSEMVRALLDGNKTQTRRPLKNQPPDKWDQYQPIFSESAGLIAHRLQSSLDLYDGGYVKQKSPFGKPGDILRVRETVAYTETCGCSDHCICPPSGTPIYRASYDDGETTWTPSIHMPKDACRLKLRVKRVWIERVQEISESDALAEGVQRIGAIFRNYLADPKDHAFLDANDSFMSLWQSIYGTLKENPWVWCCEFEKMEV